MRNNMPDIWLTRIGDAFSQLINVMLLFGRANESVSGRAGRLVGIENTKNWGWRAAYHTINFIFYPLQDDHCVSAYLADLKRAQRTIEMVTE